jgi:hypothetical protein
LVGKQWKWRVCYVGIRRIIKMVMMRGWESEVERGRRVDGRGKREEGRGKREEGRGKREEGRGERGEGRGERGEEGCHTAITQPLPD